MISRRTTTQRAVTLMETAATTTAIVACFAMLLPAVSDLRRQSKQTRCLANLGRISAASAAYAAEDTWGRIIPVHQYALFSPLAPRGQIGWGGKAGVGEPISGSFIVSSRWGTQRAWGPAKRPLNKMLYKGGFNEFSFDPGPLNENWIRDTTLDLSVFRCPGDYGYTGSHFTAWQDSKLTSYDHYGNSYAAMTFWVSSISQPLQSNSVFLRPVADVPSPSRTIAYLDNCGKFSYRQDYGIDFCSGSPPALELDPLVRGWHGSAFTFSTAFADGHVGRRYINGHLHPQPDIGRYPRDSGSDPYDSWHCVIIRGKDWQIDTLPSDPISVVDYGQSPITSAPPESSEAQGPMVPSP